MFIHNTVFFFSNLVSSTCMSLNWWGCIVICTAFFPCKHRFFQKVCCYCTCFPPGHNEFHCFNARAIKACRRAGSCSVVFYPGASTPAVPRQSRISRQDSSNGQKKASSVRNGCQGVHQAHRRRGGRTIHAQTDQCVVFARASVSVPSSARLQRLPPLF
jgi:hypothetical protein